MTEAVRTQPGRHDDGQRPHEICDPRWLIGRHVADPQSAAEVKLLDRDVELVANPRREVYQSRRRHAKRLQITYLGADMGMKPTQPHPRHPARADYRALGGGAKHSKSQLSINPAGSDGRL